MVLEILEKNSRFWNFFLEILNFLNFDAERGITIYKFKSRSQIMTPGVVKCRMISVLGKSWDFV